jgi:hypothetical protein
MLPPPSFPTPKTPNEINSFATITWWYLVLRDGLLHTDLAPIQLSVVLLTNCLLHARTAAVTAAAAVTVGVAAAAAAGMAAAAAAAGQKQWRDNVSIGYHRAARETA